MQDSPANELTVRAVLLGVGLSVILAGANAYLGLFAGMTVSASIPAAVISMGILAMLRKGTILENNMVQTAASAGESLAAGVIFTIPALVLMDYWQSFDYLWVSAIAGIGGLLGVLFSIPLRRSLIVEEGLQFPEGCATAEVLKVGQEAGRGLRNLALAALAGGLTKLSETGLRLWSATLEGAGQAGGYLFYIGTNLSPALLSVGYIVGINIAVLVFAGGALSWYVAIPLYDLVAGGSDPALVALREAGAGTGDIAWSIWNREIRYLGVGAMLVGGVWALLSMAPAIRRGVADGIRTWKAAAGGNGGPIPSTERDMPMPVIFGAIVAFTVPMFWLYQNVTSQVMVSLPMTVMMLVAGFLFSAVAAYMAGLVGSSNNPISGVTIATILTASLLLLGLMGSDAPLGPVAAIMIGAVVCSAAAISGDNMQDLKTGHLLGATPWKQQVMQFVGVISAVLVMAPILSLLLHAYGFGPATETHPNALPAPQATLMAAVAQGVFGAGLPWGMVAAGAATGVVVILVDEYLKRRSERWRAPVLAVAVGLYLPLELSVPILAGGLISEAARRALGGEANRDGMLFAAGLITGEALVGIFLAIPIVVTGQRDVLALAAEPLGGWPGLAVMGLLALWLYRVATRREGSP